MTTRPERRPGLVAARSAAALALVVGTLAVLRPFLTPMAWAAILAYLTWPVYRHVRAHTRRPRLAAALFTASVAVLIGVPVALLLIKLANDATDLVRAFGAWRDAGQPLPEWTARLLGSPWVARALELVDRLPIAESVAPGEWLGRAGREISLQLVALAGGIARNAFKFGVTLLSLYAFYVSGDELTAIGRRLAPLLFPGAPERLLERIGEGVSAVVFGLLGTAGVQGVLAGIGLAVAGVPSPVALGTATAFLSVLPGGGGAITLGSALWMALQGRPGWAIALAIWAVLVVSSVDNVLRPLLISGRGRIPFLLVFFGVLGGLATFGMIGVFIGPVLLSVALNLLAALGEAPDPLPQGASGAWKPGTPSTSA